MKKIRIASLMALIAVALSLNAQKKNVLLIISDDFNCWLPEIGYYPHAKTPNLSALANKGILFTDAQNSSPVCNPSRNAFMSGVRPVTSGISANQDGYIRDKAGFAKALTMNQYFTQQGFHTVAGGKIYHPGKMGDKKTDPNNWSELYNGSSGASGGSAYSWAVGSGSPIKWSGSTGNINNNNDTKLANHFANRIKNYSKNKPFFFAVGLFRPHLPWNCPKSFFDKYDLADMDKPVGHKAGDGSASSEHKTITNNNKWDDAIRAYLANLSYADYNVGILLDALEASGHADNTIVVFTGDHGWHLGEKQRWKKAAMWDQANHTTFIIYDPSAAGNGQKCHKVVSLQDMYPTLVDIAGLPSTNKIDGESLAPLLNNPKLNSWEKPVMITYRGTNYVKTNQYKFIDDGGSSKLYDVVNDPYEFNNLYGKAGMNSVVHEMRGHISDFIAKGKKVKDNINGVGDNQKPTVPGATTFSNITATSATLSWAKSTDNDKVSGYEVFVDGVKHTVVTGTTATIDGLTCNTSYAFKVRATDPSGNKSGFNAEKTRTTDACVPTGDPIANAGANQIVTDSDNSGAETVTLDGSASSDSDGTITSYVWTEGATQIATGVSANVSLGVGSHTITLTVTDNEGNTDTDNVTITVNEGDPCSGFTNISDLDGSVVNCAIVITWSDIPCATSYIVRRKLPTDSKFTTLGSVGGNVNSYTDNGVTEGQTYVYQVRPFDGTTKLVSNNPQINVVCGTTNEAPIANAGANQTVTDSDNNGSESISLNGSGSSDSDGTITSYVWTEGGSQIATGVSPTVSLAVGTYTITLTVTDNDGATDTDNVTITVNEGGNNEDPYDVDIFITHKSSGTRLFNNGSVEAVSTTSGSATGVNATWKLVSIASDPGYYRLEHVGSTRWFHCKEDGVSNFKLGPTTWTGERTKWKVVPADGEYVRLEHKASGLWLHVKPDGTTDFKLGPTTWLGDNTQWKLEVKPKSAESFTAKLNAKVYPNPASNEVNIELEGSESAMVSIVNMAGVVVHSQEVFNGLATINLSDMSKGMYVVTVQSETESLYQTLMVD